MSIATDTPLIPIIAAETVVEQLAAYLGEALPSTYASRMADHAEAVYAANALFRRRVNASGDLGREHLYVFMRHWLASYIKEDSEALFARLPSGFCTGAAPVRKAPVMA